MQLHPSLGVPEQLSSLFWTQVSAAAGPTDPEQAPQAEDFLSAATMHVCEPALQGPRPSRPGWAPQACVPPDGHWQIVSIVLSGRPSQSLSAADVQSRADALIAPMHAPQTPFVQVDTPGLQMPTMAGPHGCMLPLMQGQPSFATPLQLASSPAVAQLSADAGRMLQAPHRPCALQVSVPAAQFPFAPSALHERAGSPRTPMQPSFAVPLQLASSPFVAQLSADAGRMLQALHLPPVQVSMPREQFPIAPSAAQERIVPSEQAGAPPVPPPPVVPAAPPAPVVPPRPPAAAAPPVPPVDPPTLPPTPPPTPPVPLPPPTLPPAPPLPPRPPPPAPPRPPPPAPAPPSEPDPLNLIASAAQPPGSGPVMPPAVPSVVCPRRATAVMVTFLPIG